MDIKPGYKTTEFWLTVLATVVGLVVASGGAPHAGPVAQALALIGSALATAGYSVSRGNAKSV